MGVLPSVVGLDLSLTGTGVCVNGVPDTIRTRLVGIERLHHIRMELLRAVDGCDLVALEGYAMGTARQAGTYAVGELGGIVRYALWDIDMPYVEIPPATLKQFATGKGNANKDAMVATAARAGCPADDNNAVDAWWLYEMAQYALAPDIPEFPVTLSRTAYRDQAVRKVIWPELKALDEPDPALTRRVREQHRTDIEGRRGAEWLQPQV